MINKKGLFFHWVILGMILAVGLFLAITNRFTLKQEPPGKWSTNFIVNTLLPAEIDLLNNDQQAREAAWEVIKQLASKGGFAGDSDCGQVAQINLWNSADRWCIPLVKDVARNLVESKISQTNVAFIGTMLLANGERKVIVPPGKAKQRYEYKTDIAVNLAYSFDEYAFLEQQARLLVKNCANSPNLRQCLTEKKEPSWHQCEEETVGKVGLFCVPSPNNYFINGQLVVYKFGLQFGEELVVS